MCREIETMCVLCIREYSEYTNSKTNNQELDHAAKNFSILAYICTLLDIANKKIALIEIQYIMNVLKTTVDVIAKLPRLMFCVNVFHFIASAHHFS